MVGWLGALLLIGAAPWATAAFYRYRLNKHTPGRWQ